MPRLPIRLCILRKYGWLMSAFPTPGIYRPRVPYQAVARSVIPPKSLRQVALPENCS